VRSLNPLSGVMPWIAIPTALFGGGRPTARRDGREVSERKWVKSVRHTSWLGFLDTYRTLCIDPTAEIRLVFEEIRSSGQDK
jgi:hypothetical protein